MRGTQLNLDPTTLTTLTQNATQLGVAVPETVGRRASVHGMRYGLEHFTFTEVSGDADIEIDFTLGRDDSALGRGSGPSDPPALIDGRRRQRGSIRIRRVRNWGQAGQHFPWTEPELGQVVTHEIGHVLGLQHSNVKGSLMFPYDINDSWNFPPLDGETAEVLRDLYGWAFHNFSDGRTSADPPSLARTTEPAGFGSGTWRRARSLLHMVWTGPEGVPGLSYSQSGNHGRTWTTKRQLTWPPNGTPVHGTALASYSTGADPAQNEFLLAWAGESEQLWYATSLGDGVNVPAVRLIGHSSDPSRGTRGRCGRPPRLEVQRRPAGLVGHLPRGTWSTAIAIPHLITEHAPALGISDGRVFIVVRNPNNSLLVECELLPDGRWTQPRAVTTFDFSGGPGNEAAPEGSPAYTTTSTHEPSATTPRSGEMLLAFRRSNGRLATLRRGRFGGGSVPVWKYFSDKAPAVAAVDDDVVVVGIGPDQRLYYVFREARLGLAERYDEPGSMQQVADLIRHL